MADGPTIQNTSEIALKNGMNMDLIFQQLKEINTTIPIVLMGYLNPVITFGLENFLSKCQETNIRTVILPDLSLEIYERYHKKMFELYSVYPVFLVTPKTEPSRITRISEACKESFVYLVSSNSTTGTKLTENVNNYAIYKGFKSLCGKTPLFIGFGIKTKADVIRIQQSSDGAIIGSAYLEAVKNEKALDFLQKLR
jgi:tryptophan synthase alpha chain